jgi:hypothetical protein
MFNESVVGVSLNKIESEDTSHAREEHDISTDNQQDPKTVKPVPDFIDEHIVTTIPVKTQERSIIAEQRSLYCFCSA